MAVTPEKKPPGRPVSVDWEAMEPHWRAGILSVTELAKRFKCSRQAITKHWAKAGVERDLTSQIQGQAAAIVQRAEASGGQIVPQLPAVRAPDAIPTATETVAFNAVMQAGVILRQRRDINRAQALCGELLTELESQTFDRTLYQRLDELLRQAARSGKVEAKALVEMQALYARVTTHSSRVENTRKLAETMKVLTELERRVLSIADDTPVDPARRVEEARDNGLEELRRRFKAKVGLS